jgi:hypothetical protein
LFIIQVEKKHGKYRKKQAQYTKQLHEANVFFDKAIALEPKNKELYFLQAEIYEKQKKILEKGVKNESVNLERINFTHI